MGLALQTMEFFDLSGGLNDHSSDTSVLDNEWTFLRNANFTKDGSIQTRAGQIRLNLTQINSGAQFYLDFYYALDNGTTDRLIVVGDSLYRQNGGSPVLIDAGNALTYWSAAQLANRILLVNGTDANRKFDGTNLYNLGIAAPVDGAPTLDAAPSGVGTLPIGNYTYTYTYRNSVTFDESNPVNTTAAGFTTATAASAGLGITLGGVNPFVPSTDPQVDQIVIYRSLVNTTTPLFEIATKANDAAAFVDNGFADGVFELETDNDIAPIANMNAGFINRHYLAVNDTLYYSKSLIPGSVPSDQLFRIGRDGQPITCLLPIGNDALLIGKKRSIYILTGDPIDDNAVPQLFNNQHGILNHRSANNLGYQVYFIDQSQRPYVLDPTQLANAERRVYYVGKRIATINGQISTSASEHIKTMSFESEDRVEWYVSVPLFVNDRTDTMFVLDLTTEASKEQGSWSVYDNVQAGSLQAWPDSDGIVRLWRGDFNGFMWQMHFTQSDGATVNSTATAAGASTLTDTTLVSETSIATAGGAATLTDAAATYTVNEFVGQQLYIFAGTGVGQTREILSNTATVLTVTAVWGVIPDATSQYYIGGLTVDGLAGVPVLIAAGTGIGQTRYITTNTPVTITISSPWDIVPAAGSTYAIGGIDFEIWSNWKKLTTNEIIKRLWFLWFNLSQVGNYEVDIRLQFDFNTDLSATTYLTLTVSQTNSQWGFFLWGSGVWGGVSSFIEKLQLDQYFHHVRIGLKKVAAGQPISLNGQSLSFQEKGLFVA
ncbi:MAG: hypothetical protein KBC72_00555 [Acinetobacter sp.]|nr:hypothetical protein [Acinetobacter sp.]